VYINQSAATETKQKKETKAIISYSARKTDTLLMRCPNCSCKKSQVKQTTRTLNTGKVANNIDMKGKKKEKRSVGIKQPCAHHDACPICFNFRLSREVKRINRHTHPLT
jgi:hypothetical protein